MSDKDYIKTIEKDNERLQKENDTLKEEIEILKSEMRKEQRYRDDGKYDSSDYYNEYHKKAIEEASHALSKANDEESKHYTNAKFKQLQKYKKKQVYDKWWSSDYDDAE